MENSEKVALGTTLAGVNQYKVFSAVMNNFDQAVKATNASLDSEGATLRQNEVYMDSLEAKTSALKQEFQKFVLGEGGLQQLGKIIIDVSTSIMKLVNNLGGLKTILVALTGVIITLNTEAIAEFISKIGIAISNVGTFSVQLIKATIEAKSLSGGLQLLGIGATTAQVALGALTAIITVATIAFYKYNQAQEEMLQNAKDSLSAFTSYQSTLAETLDSINDESTTKSGLLEINKKLNKSYDDEEQKQKGINTIRKENLRLLYEEARLKAQETLRESGSQYTKSKNYLESNQTGYITQVTLFDDIIDGTAKPKEKLEQLGNALDKYSDKIAKNEELTKAEKSEYSSLTNQYNLLKTKVEENEDIVTKYNEALKISNMSYDEYIEYLKNATTENKNYSGSLEDDENAQEELAKEFDKLLEKYKLSATSLDKLKENYKTLGTALDEINNEGKLSISTYESLISLSPAYAQALFKENGELRDNIESQEELYKLKIEQMALDQADSLVKLAEYYDGTTKSLDKLNKALSLNNDLTWSGIYARIADLQNQKGLADDVVQTLMAQVSRYQSWANSAIKSIHDYAVDQSDDATEKIKADLEEQKEALNSLKKEIQNTINAINDDLDKYKRVFSFLSSELDKQINLLKDQKSAEVDLIETEIKAQEKIKSKVKDYYSNRVSEEEKLRDSRVETIEAELDALEKQKDAETEFWDKKIDALKEQNNALKDQLEYEQLLESLAKAKSTKVKVYREGQGFVYETNADEVNKAQQKLDEYNANKKYEDELALLTKNKEDTLKATQAKIDAKKEEKEEVKNASNAIIEQLKEEADTFEKTYERIIEDLETKKQAVEDDYDAKIKKIEEYKDKLEEQSNSYQHEQDRLLTLQMTGIDTEQEHWETRLGNLDGFVKDYNAKLAELSNKQEALNDIDKQLNELETKIDRVKKGLSEISNNGDGEEDTSAPDMNAFGQATHIAEQNYLQSLGDNGVSTIPASLTNAFDGFYLLKNINSVFKGNTENEAINKALELSKQTGELYKAIDNEVYQYKKFTNEAERQQFFVDNYVKGWRFDRTEYSTNSKVNAIYSSSNNGLGNYASLSNLSNYGYNYSGVKATEKDNTTNNNASYEFNFDNVTFTSADFNEFINDAKNFSMIQMSYNVL